MKNATERVAQLIDDAERAYFFGTGSSGLIAREMKLKVFYAIR